MWLSSLISNLVIFKANNWDNWDINRNNFLGLKIENQYIFEESIKKILN